MTDIMTDTSTDIDQVTTVKIRKTTRDLLKQVARQRHRRESLEQVILELLDQYIKANYVE